MASRFRHLFFQGAASAFLACATPAFADPDDDPANLPRWMVRAQRRLALKPSQQLELRDLADLNGSKLTALQRRRGLRAGDEEVRARRPEIADLQREFRDGLAVILSPQQLAAWDSLLAELLGEVRPHDAPLPGGRQH